MEIQFGGESNLWKMYSVHLRRSRFWLKSFTFTPEEISITGDFGPKNQNSPPKNKIRLKKNGSLVIAILCVGNFCPKNQHPQKNVLEFSSLKTKTIKKKVHVPQFCLCLVNLTSLEAKRK